MDDQPDRGSDRPGDDQYSWLSERSSGPRPDRGTEGGHDPDETQAMPTPGRDRGDRGDQGDRGGQGGEDSTRAIPPTEQPEGSPRPDDGRARSEPLPPPVLPPPGRRQGSGGGDSSDGYSRGDGRQRPPRRPRARGTRVRRIVLVVLLVWVAFLIAVPIWAWSRIDTVDAEPGGDRPGDQPGHTYLVVGSDSREGLSEEERQDLATGSASGGRTDTILLLHTGDGPTLLLSLPRDSPVEIPGEGTNKINAAFAFGGPELLVETVEQNTGIRVDGYVEIGIGGFVSIVDALGGVEVCPDEAIADPKAGLDIEAGCQELEGNDALGYARTRDFATADLQRVQNQREVVSAIGDSALSPWTLLNPWRYFQLSSAGADSLTIGEDVGPVDLARFAWAMGSVSGDGLTCTVPLASTDATWNPDLAPQLFQLVAEDRTAEIDDDLCRSSGLAE